MDFEMPIMDGREATKELKQKYPEQLIIGVTAVDQEQIEKAEGFDYVL